MSKRAKSRSTTTVRNIIRIAIVVTVMLILDVILASTVYTGKPSEALLKPLLFIEGGVFLFIGVMRGGGTSTGVARDEFMEREGVLLRPDRRESDRKKRIATGTLVIAAVLMIIGATLMGLAFIIP